MRRSGEITAGSSYRSVYAEPPLGVFVDPAFARVRLFQAGSRTRVIPS